MHASAQVVVPPEASREYSKWQARQICVAEAVQRTLTQPRQLWPEEAHAVIVEVRQLREYARRVVDMQRHADTHRLRNRRVCRRVVAQRRQDQVELRTCRAAPRHAVQSKK